MDYKPKRIDYGELKQGQFVELLNVFQLDNAEINLHAIHITGVFLIISMIIVKPNI